MRRQDIQLLAGARQGDLAARCEVGRRYLQGNDSFPRHLALGLEYLSHASVAGSERAAIIVAESLSLHEIASLQQLRALAQAAKASSALAQFKWGVWICLTRSEPGESMHWFELAAAQGNAGARLALAALENRGPDDPAIAVLRALAGEPAINPMALVTIALQLALNDDDESHLGRALDCALLVQSGADADLADTVCDVLERAQNLTRFPLSCASQQLEAVLEDCVRRGSAGAALLLGRALCGLRCGPLSAGQLTTGQNMRKGAALLLRAADSGRVEAWTHLYDVHSDNHSSVANPQMARFFLEKAAVGGSVPAQRRLGALILRSATTLHESEQGIHWLHEAAQRQDVLALRLLQSLVLPVSGSNCDAECAIDAVWQEDPWMACRLRTAREFGLTKLEGLSIDIVAGIRPWGLVVGANPFITQAKLSAPRAVPAPTPDAARHLRRCVAFLEQSRQEGSAIEGDLRKRSERLRRLLGRLGAEEALFFADVRSTTLNALRQGTKWAFRAKQPLRMALAAQPVEKWGLAGTDSRSKREAQDMRKP